MIPSTIYALFFLFTVVHAIPLQWSLERRDVIDPPITSPDASTTWNVGETVTVTWNLSALPPNTNVTGAKGKLVLGYSTWENEHLDIDNPLATNFLLSDSQVSFVVPSVPTRNNYIVDLFGDSGNISPNFTIIGMDSSSTTESTSTSTSETVTSTTSESVSVTYTSEVSTAVTTAIDSGSSSPVESSSPTGSLSTAVPATTAVSSGIISVPSVSTASSPSRTSSSVSTSGSSTAGSDASSPTSGALASAVAHPALAMVIAVASLLML